MAKAITNTTATPKAKPEVKKPKTNAEAKAEWQKAVQAGIAARSKEV